MFFFLLVLISCKVPTSVSVETAQEKCKSRIHAMLESRAALLLQTKGGTFSFDHENVDTPADWQTKRWNFEYGEVFAFGAIDAKYFDYAQSLLDLENYIENSECVVTTKEFKKYFKEPSQIVRSRDSVDYFYMVNSKKYPECFREHVIEGEKYIHCRIFIVKFDLEERFKKVLIGTFAYR